VLKIAVRVRVGSSVSVPSVVAPCLKATVPVGVLPLELTAAVKVIVCPTLDGFGPEVSMVVAPALLTFCVTVPEPVAKVTSPSVDRRDRLRPCA
jgi:hypothetical protein